MPHYKLFFCSVHQYIHHVCQFPPFESRATRLYPAMSVHQPVRLFWRLWAVSALPLQPICFVPLSTIFFTAPARPHATLGAVYQALFVACYTTLRPTLLVVNHKFGVCRYKSLWSWILCLYSQVLSLFSWILSLWLWISSLWSVTTGHKSYVCVVVIFDFVVVIRGSNFLVWSQF